MLRMVGVKSRLAHYRILSSHLRSPIDQVAFALLAASNLVIPSLFRRFPVYRTLHFDDFSLKVRIGQTELSPLFEIWEAFASGIFDDRTSQWTVIDCGANIGQFSVFFANARRLVAIEPNTDILRQLEHNLTINNANFTIVASAVSSTLGTVGMIFSHRDTTNSYVVEDGGYQIKATTIDSIIEENDLELVDLLKLDIEEHEISALEGALQSLRLGKIQRIYTEFRSDALLKQIDDLLFSLGFQRVKIIPCCSAYYERLG